MKIIAPKPHNHIYNYFVEIDENYYSGWLTYQLANKNKSRDIVLVPATEQILDKIDVQERILYDALVKRIKESKQRGRFQTAKSLANELSSNPASLPSAGVVVHRFGPVPVHILNDKVTIEGSKNELRVCLYPSMKSNCQYPGESKSNSDFLNSLLINPSLLVKRYFEDINGFFYQIRNHTSIWNSLNCARDAQRILSESVGTKITAAHKALEALKNRNNRKKSELLIKQEAEIAKQIMKKDEFLTAEAARILGFLMLRDYYRILGIDRHDKNYRSKLEDMKDSNRRALRTRLNALFPEMKIDSLRNSSPALSCVFEAWENWPTGHQMSWQLPESYENLPEEHWLQEYMEFGKWITSGIKSPSVLETPRVFVSYTFKDDKTHNVRDLVKEHIETSTGIRLLFVPQEDYKLGKPITKKLRDLIWKSEATVGLVAKQDNYDWMHKEFQHSYHVKNHCITCIVDEKIVQSFKVVNEEISWLSEMRHHVDNRRAKYLEKLNDFPYISYSNSTPGILDSQLSSYLYKLSDTIFNETLKNLMGAFSRNLSIKERQCLKDVLIILKDAYGYLNSKRLKDLCEKITGNRNAWQYMWRRVKQVVFVLGDNQYTIISRNPRNNREYKNGLSEIIQALKGKILKRDFQKNENEAYFHECLDYICAQTEPILSIKHHQTETAV